MTVWIDKTRPENFKCETIYWDRHQHGWVVPAGQTGYLIFIGENDHDRPLQIKLIFSGEDYIDVILGWRTIDHRGDTGEYYKADAEDAHYVSGSVLYTNFTINDDDITTTAAPESWQRYIKITNNGSTDVLITKIAFSKTHPDATKVSTSEIVLLQSDGNRIRASLSNPKLVTDGSRVYCVVNADFGSPYYTWGEQNDYAQITSYDWGMILEKTDDGWRHLYREFDAGEGGPIEPDVPGLVSLGAQHSSVISKYGHVYIANLFQRETSTLDLRITSNAVCGVELDRTIPQNRALNYYDEFDFSDEYYGYSPSIGIDSKNNIYCAYLANDLNHLRVIKRHISDTRSMQNFVFPSVFSDLIVENTSGQWYYFLNCRLFVDKDDNVHVIYTRYNGSVVSPVMYHIKTVNGVWSAPTKITDGEFSESHPANYHLGPDNKIHAIGYIGLYSNFYHLWYDGTWHSDILSLPFVYDSGKYFSTFVDPYGRVCGFTSNDFFYIDEANDVHLFKIDTQLGNLYPNHCCYDYVNNKVCIVYVSDEYQNSKLYYAEIDYYDLPHETLSLSSISSSSESSSQDSKSSESVSSASLSFSSVSESQFSFSESSFSFSSISSPDWHLVESDERWTTYGLIGSWYEAGQRWVPKNTGYNYALVLYPINNWVQGYKPRGFRLTMNFTGGAKNFIVNWGDIYYNASESFTSMVPNEHDFNWYSDSQQIESLRIYCATSFTLENIEFYGEEESPSSESSSYSSGSVGPSVSSSSISSSSESLSSESLPSLSFSSISFQRELADVFELCDFDIENISSESSSSSHSSKSFWIAWS